MKPYVAFLKCKGQFVSQDFSSEEEFSKSVKGSRDSTLVECAHLFEKKSGKLILSVFNAL